MNIPELSRVVPNRPNDATTWAKGPANMQEKQRKADVYSRFPTRKLFMSLADPMIADIAHAISVNCHPLSCLVPSPSRIAEHYSW
jgi:hypothetical protein